MLERLTCVQGHAWEALTASEAARCPECGLPPDPGSFAEPEDVASIPTAVPMSDDQGRPVVAGYEILADRGRSPNGVRLYQARQLLANREVLLQVVLAREDSGQRAWNALRGEASGHGRLSHPHILQLYETGERDRQLFYNAMEFVDGPTLTEAVGDDLLPLEQILPLMEALARAVAYANDQRQLHRHLEPGVILLQRVPAPKSGPAKDDPGGGVCRIHDESFIPRIRGFGLARRPIEGDIIDLDLFAEPNYLSPEQSLGKGQDFGPHTDVYGLGGILYFLLTGRPPFRGPTQDDILDAVQTAPLVKPSDIRKTPAALQFVCCAALARRVRRRYPDATSMADDLRLIAEYRAPELFKTTAIGRFGLWRKRRPGLAAMLVMSLVCMVSTLIAFAIGASSDVSQSSRLRPVDYDAMQRALDTSRARLREVTEWQRIQDYQGRINFAALVAGVNKEATRKALDECPESERRFEWHYLDRLLVGEEKTTLPKTSNATAFAFHGPDGNAVAVAKTIPGEDKAIIRVIAVASSDDRFELNIFESPVRRMVYLESKKLAVLAGTKPGRLYLFDWQEVTGMKDTVASPTHIAFSPQDNQLLVLNAAGQLRHHDANDARPSGTIRSFLPRDLEDADSVRMAILPRDLGVVVSNPAGGDIRVWPVGSPQERRDDLTRTIEGKIQWMTSDAEGTLAVATNTRRLCFGKMNGGDSISPYTGLKGEVKHMAFSPDGKRLAIAYADDTLAVLGYLPPRPEELRINNKVEPAKWVELLTIPVSGVRGVEFSPNGTALAVANPQGVVVLGAWK